MESKEEEGTLQCSHRTPGKDLAGFPMPHPMAVPSNLPATRLEGSQLGKELSPENVTGCSISLAHPEEISLKDEEKIGDLILEYLSKQLSGWLTC